MLKSSILKYFIFISLFVATFGLHAQTEIDSSLAGRPIGKIEIMGNTKTQTSFILRELKQKSGDPLDLALMEEGRKRIQNLKLFHRVLVIGQPRDRFVDILILVTEQWYIFPFPILHINERDWGKISYGAGIAHTNFRGIGEQLSFYFKLGYNPSTHLSYVSPWLFGPQNLSGGMDFYYQQVESKHYTEREVYEYHLGGDISFGKRFNHHYESQLKLGYESVSLHAKNQDDLHTSTDGMPVFGINMVWDYRDLKEYPHKGWYFKLSGQKVGLPDRRIDFSKSHTDFRFYVPIHKTTLAFRMETTLSQGDIPVYDQVYLGYNERIRGHFFETFEGENRGQMNLAFRFPILPIRYFDAGEEPYMQDWPLGLSAGIFCDTGVVWDQRENLNSSMLITGYGVGLHFHLPFVQVLRLELAFNERGGSETILDMMVFY